MARELEGKVAIVTGGASGLGEASARLFVEEGGRVVIADVNVEAGEKIASELGAAAIFQRTDVSQADEVQALVDVAVSHFGDLHVMFNNAGISGTRHGRFLDHDMADFETVMGVNLYGVMVGTQRAARYMEAHGGGSIINTTSIAALAPGGGVMCYRVAKAGVVLFTQSMAMELGPLGIRVNCIAPGLIQTPMTTATYDMGPVIEKMQPLARIGAPIDVANAALYLASDRSAQVTGMILPVDGGTSLGAPVRRPPKAASKSGSAKD